MRPGDGLQLGSTVTLELDPESTTKAAGPSANQTISFFFVCAFGLGVSRAVGRELGTHCRIVGGKVAIKIFASQEAPQCRSN